MNKEEIESFKELNTDLEDIDDLDMGLEIISYKVRTTMQEFANTIINLQSQLDISNKKLEEINSVVRKIEDSPYLYWDNVQRILLSIIGGE
jgi:hypothetical protein